MQKDKIETIVDAYNSMYEKKVPLKLRPDNSKDAKEHEEHAEMHKRCAERMEKEDSDFGEPDDFYNEVIDAHIHAHHVHKKAAAMLKKGKQGAKEQSITAHKVSKNVFKQEGGQDSIAHHDAAAEYFDSK